MMLGRLSAQRAICSASAGPVAYSFIVRMPRTRATRRTEKWSLRFSPTPGRCCTTGIPSACRCCALPMPDSCSNFGVLIAPQQTMTSRFASTRLGAPAWPLTMYSTPRARCCSTRMRVACARVRMTRLARPRTGRKKALALLMRQPRAMVRWQEPAAARRLRRPVVVGVPGNAQTDGTFDESLAQPMSPVVVGHRQFAAAPAIGIVPAGAALGALEIRQHLGIAPPGVAEAGPVVVVRRQAAVVNQAVDRAGAAERAPLRHRDAPAVGPCRSFSLKRPGEARVEQHPDEAGRNVQERVPVGRPCFEQADRGLAVGAKPVGQD